MSGHKRNIAVGSTILLAFALLGWMILRFADVPLRLLAAPQIPVQFVATSAEGLSEGSAVLYLGVSVGRVTHIHLSDSERSVTIDALIDEQPELPGNVEGVIRTQLLGGGSSISILPARGEQSAVKLQKNQRIMTKYVGVDILPPELSGLAADLTATSQELRRLAQKVRESDLIEKLVATVGTINDDAAKAGKVLEKIDSLVGDETMRKNIQGAVANFTEVSETAKRIGANLEKLSVDANTRFNQFADRGDKVLNTAQASVESLTKQLGDRLTQAAGIFAQLEQISRKINEGKGTAGMLVNDPVLYQNLLDVSKELKLTIENIRRVVEEWEQEGVPLKLK